MHLDVAIVGDVEVRAGENGVRAEGTALIGIAGDLCLIAGGEDAVRARGNASIDTDGCTDLDLVGDVDDDDGGGDDDDDDQDEDR